MHPRGLIVVHPGQQNPWSGPILPYTQSAITRPIYDPSGKVDVDVAHSTETPLPLPPRSTLGGHTDNHIVRHKDGSLLAVRACGYWAPVNNPKSWQQASLPDNRGSTATHVGMRGANVCWRGAAVSGGLTWTLQGAADPFLVNPSPGDGYCASDRPEAYACPFTGYVYIAARYYPFSAMKDPAWKAVPTDGTASVQLVVLCSKDKGKTWQVVVTLTGAASTNPPLVMTSTPNGRLFLFHWVGGAGELFCSNLFNASVGELPQIHAVYGQEEHDVGDSTNGYRLVLNESIVGYSEKVNGKSTGAPPDASVDAKNVNTISHPTLSRASTDKSTSRIRVSLLALNEHGRNIYVIVDVGVRDLDGLPHIEPGSLKRAAKIAAKDPVGHSVLRGTFIDPDYISLPSGYTSNTAMFYWLDWPAGTATDLSARYCFISGWPSQASAIGPLSVANGAPRSWSTADPGGDYMTGGFFFREGLNYVPQWRESDGIRANVVHIKPPVQIKLPKP
jgi:hypothetical protein